MSEHKTALTEQEITQQLSTHNEDVIKELYSLTLKLNDHENDRTKSLDGKAAALFGFIAALISAIFVLLGLLGDAKGNRLVPILSGNIFFSVLFSLIVLAVALLFLLKCIAVKSTWKSPGEIDLISAVQTYDRHIDGQPDESNSSKSAHDYRRHLTEHFWKLYRNAFDRNEEKAQDLRVAQYAIFIALFVLVAIQVTAMLELRSSIMSNSSKPTASTESISTPTASSSPSPQPTSTRPSSLPVSSAGRPTNDSAGRPAPLQASSTGKPTRLSEGRPAPLPPSGRGSRLSNSSDSKGGK